MEKKIIQVDEKVPVKMLIPLSLQHMFAMFGASVLVPFLFGISPAIVLLMNGVGTLVFIVVTKGKAPAYLGSSFAFLVPAGLVIEKFGYQYALGSFVAIGFGGIIVALIIRKFGTKWIHIVLPTAAMGPVVALIGLELAGNAASNAGLLDDTWRCRVWTDPFSRVPRCDPDPDRDYFRLCGSCGLRYPRFHGSGTGILLRTAEFPVSEV